MHFGIEVFWWCIPVKAIMRGVYTILCISWLPHVPSQAFDDVSTPVFDRALVIVIPPHIM
jgi:hypothetical protein